ncbi:sugar porter family MFS transporter [uncultured Cetobacterium sp.]|uniref:sugar porter family MFS transporter n=1 Tax=uncultured Cetobacterium sp. TaxID=527638 RepID=UPI002633D398|nr:sugar porter family MFS transporter [uncultured Cetobacterium sp.]
MKRKNIYFVATIIALAGFIFSYDSANLGGSVKYLREYFNIPADKVGILVIASLIGNFTGSLFAGYFSDLIGRKKTLIFAISLGIIGLSITILSKSLILFYVGRIIFGISLGSLFVAAPMYIVEVSPASKRGRTGAIRQILLAFGLILGYSVTYFFERAFSLQWNTMTGWRVLIGIEILFLIFMFLAFFTLSESPRWLIMKRRDQEAKTSLSEFIDNPERVELVYSEMISNRPKQSENKKIKIKGGLIYALLICAIFPIFRQLSGVNAITYYAQRIFSNISKGGSNLAYFQSIFIGVSELGGAIFVVIFADKMGRKVLLLMGVLGMFFSESLVTYFLYIQKIDIDVSYLIYVYNFFFTISAGAMLTVYISEVVPTVIRSKGSSLSGMLNWITDAIVIYSFPLINTNIYLTERFHGSFSFGIFSVSMFLFFIVILFLPETKGKTLEEIAIYWKTKGDWE